jgi:hypothetical protein
MASPDPPEERAKHWLLRDLTSPFWLYTKAMLFLSIGLVSAGLLLAQSPTLITALLLCLTIWAFCRAYYFAFYVIEHYIDPRFRFAGLGAFMAYMLSSRQRVDDGTQDDAP